MEKWNDDPENVSGQFYKDHRDRDMLEQGKKEPKKELANSGGSMRSSKQRQKSSKIRRESDSNTGRIYLTRQEFERLKERIENETDKKRKSELKKIRDCAVVIDPVYVTERDYQRIEEQLRNLVRERNEIMKTLGEEALSDGYVDLRENQTFMEKRTRIQNEYRRRIAELEDLLKRARIVEHSSEDLPDPGIVRIGAKVVVEVDGDRQEFIITGKLGGDVRRGFISNESLVGKALIGHKAGESVDVETPDGKVVYKIIQVSYA